VPQGFIFAGITIASVVVMFFYMFFTQENSLEIIELPFYKNTLQAETGFWLGVFSVILLNIPALFKITAQTTYNLIRPFYIFSSGTGAITGQSLNVIKLQLSAGLGSFFTTAVAGGLESIAFNIVAVWIGILVGIVILSWAGVKVKDLKKHRFFLIMVGFASTGLFVWMAHTLNQTYQGSMFIVAVVFFILMNVIIYFGDNIGLKVISGLMFIVGFHFMNNFYANGFLQTLNDLFFTLTGFLLIGWLLLGSLIHVVYQATMNWKAYKKELLE
jgi:small basic protein